MKLIPCRKAILFFLVLFAAISVCDAQQYKRSIRNPERQLFGKSLNNKTVKYKEPRAVVKAKKKQASNQKKLKKEYAAYVKMQKRRHFNMQSPEVKSRMIENQKETEQKYREKKKIMKAESRKKTRKYG